MSIFLTAGFNFVFWKHARLLKQLVSLNIVSLRRRRKFLLFPLFHWWWMSIFATMTTTPGKCITCSQYQEILLFSFGKLSALVPRQNSKCPVALQAWHLCSSIIHCSIRRYRLYSLNWSHYMCPFSKPKRIRITLVMRKPHIYSVKEIFRGAHTCQKSWARPACSIR